MFYSKLLLAAPLGVLGALLALAGCDGGSVAKICRFDAECAAGQICIGVPQLPTGTCGTFSFPDASAPERDGGAATEDGGVEAEDGGATREDGGASLSDGGHAADGGHGPDGGQAADGGPASDGGLVLDGGRGGESCESATVLSAGIIRQQTTVGYSNDFTGGSGCSSTAGADRVFAISVSASQRLVAKVTPTTTGFDPSINLVVGPAANCRGTVTCVASDDSGEADAANTASYFNGTAAAQTVFVIVDTFYSDAEARGTFDLELTLDNSPVLRNPGDTCATAVLLTPGSLSGSTAGLVADYGSGTGCSGTSGADGVYKLALPTGRELTATVAGTGTFDPSISIGLEGSACTSTNRSCLGGADSGGATDPNTVRYANQSGATQTIFIFIDSATAGATGPFTLTTSLADAPVGTPGDTCATATSIGATTVSGTTIGYQNDFSTGSGCAGSAGADRMYSIVVPGNMMLTVTVTPTGASWDPSLSLVRGPMATACTGTHTCVASADTGDDAQPDTVSYTNTSGIPETIFIVIDSFYATHAGTYTLHTVYSQP